MSRVLLYLSVFSIIAAFASESFSRPTFPARIPNGTKISCGTCHQGGIGGAPRNPFGQDVESRLEGGLVVWNEELANLDSDGDGATNGVELGDPSGTWKPGDQNPDVEVYLPGDASSTPPASSVDDYAATSGISINTIGPNPFTTKVTFKLNIENAGNLHVIVSDMNGNTFSLNNSKVNSGTHVIEWDGVMANGMFAAPGNYIVHFQMNGQILSENVVFIR